MNTIALKALVKRNPLYKGFQKTANQLMWLCGRNLCGSKTSLSQEAALEIVRNRWPKPNQPQQKPRMEYAQEDMDLSVIVPVYNMENFVEQAIHSVLDQTPSYRVELILVDDGSKDSSPKILDAYADRPNVIVVHKQNGGLASARNEGLKYASGNYIMFLDSDDYLGNNCISRLLDKAYQENCDIVQMQYVHFSDQVQTPSGFHWPFSSTGQYLEKCRIPGHACMKIFRSSLFAGLFFPEGYWYEDTIVRMILFERCGKLGTIPEVGYFYRMNATGITYSKRKSYRCLEAYWIIPAVMKQREALGMPMSEGIYIQLIEHLSVLLYHRTKSVDEKTREALFLLSCGMIREAQAALEKRTIPMTKKMAWLERAFLNQDFGLWKWYCRCHPL